MNDPTRKWRPVSPVGQLAGTTEGHVKDLNSREESAALALPTPSLDRARRSTRRWRVLSLFFLVALVAFAWFHFHQFPERGVRLKLKPFRTLTVQESGYGEAHVPIIPIKGAIAGDPLGPEEVSNTPRYLYDALELAKSEKNLAAAVLYIDSGGGDLYSSIESYRVVMQFAEETKIPVYAYVPRQSSSGAYLIALAAKEIVADPVAVVGNIGVIMRRMNTYQFGRRLGIEELNITTGPQKDAGGQWKKQNPADDAIDRRAISVQFKEFLAALKHGRPGLEGMDLLREAKKPGGITSGARFVARDAKQKGLIDHVMVFQEFLRHVADDLAKSSTSSYHTVAFMKYDEKLPLVEGWEDQLKNVKASGSPPSTQPKSAIPGCSFVNDLLLNALNWE